MATFIVRRLLQTIIVIFIVSFITFSLLHILPGDPAQIMLGLDATQEQIDALRHALWLDRSFLVQYGHWVTNVLQGNLGTSISYNEKVSSLIATRLPKTFYLGLIALLLSIIISIPAGIIS